jgi:hypothetical protein
VQIRIEAQEMKRPQFITGAFLFHFRILSEFCRFFDQFSDRPLMVFQPAGHRWRFLERHVLTAEIVVTEPQRQSMTVILPFLAETPNFVSISGCERDEAVNSKGSVN